MNSSLSCHDYLRSNHPRILIRDVIRAKGTENGKQKWIHLGELSNEEVNDDVYLLPRPLGPCPVDRPLAIGTKLRWQTHKQTNKKQKCQTEHRNGEADKMIWCVTTKFKVQWLCRQTACVLFCRLSNDGGERRHVFSQPLLLRAQLGCRPQSLPGWRHHVVHDQQTLAEYLNGGCWRNTSS